MPDSAQAGVRPTSIIQILEKDDTVASAWANIASRGDHVDRDAVHTIIIECKALAALNQKSLESLAQDMARFDALRSAVKLLASHYADAPMLRSDNESQMRRLEGHNDVVAASRTMLDWMLTDIESGSQAVAKAYKNTYPSSQKRSQADAEQVAFKKMLSSHLQFFFGHPLDSLVAAVSSALYAGNEPVSIESVRKARRREQTRVRPGEKGLISPPPDDFRSKMP
jgi:hypothetical protein